MWLDCVAFAGLLVLCGWFYCAAFGWFVAGFSLLVVKLICWGLICVFNSGRVADLRCVDVFCGSMLFLIVWIGVVLLCFVCYCCALGFGLGFGSL